MNDSFDLQIVLLLSDLIQTLVDQNKSVAVVEDDDILEFEQRAWLRPTFNLPLIHNVMVFHFDDCIERTYVGVFIVGKGCGDGMWEAGRCYFYGKVLGVDLEGTSRWGSKGTWRRL